MADVEDESSYLFTEPDPKPLRRGPKPPGENSRGLHRNKILSAVIHETAERGFVETSVGDIARRAKVSRRTFYEHFDGKESAFLAAFDVGVDSLQGNVDRALASASNWSDRLLRGMQAYVEVLTRNAALTRVFVLEVGRAGAAGYEHESRHRDWWARVLRNEIASARASDAGLASVTRDLSEDMAAAVVGGFSGLIRRWLDHGDGERLLTDSLVLLVSVLTENAHVAVALMQQGATQDQLATFLVEQPARIAGF